MTAVEAARRFAYFRALQKNLRLYEELYGDVCGLSMLRRHVIEQMRKFAKLMRYGAAAVLLVAFVTAAMAHSWYPWECCSDNDCKPVPCDELVETPTGYLYRGVTFAKASERPSQDRHCHVCILGGRGLCVFTLQGS